MAVYTVFKQPVSRNWRCLPNIFQLWFSNYPDRYFQRWWCIWICILQALLGYITHYILRIKSLASARVIHILRDETSRLVLKIHAPDSVLIKNLAMYNYQSAKPSEFICGCSFICPELFLDTMYTGLMTIKLISQFTFKEEGYIQTFCILAQETSRTQPIKSLYEEVKRAGA